VIFERVKTRTDGAPAPAPSLYFGQSSVPDNAPLAPAFYVRMITPLDLNSAPPHELTQLPGVSKNIAYNIVNHRNRHGHFTAWEELLEVKGFPAEKLEALKKRAVLGHDGEDPAHIAPPRHLHARIAEDRKKTKGYTHAIRTTRRAGKLGQGAGPRH
jgi:Helix-hairpin-helix motif